MNLYLISQNKNQNYDTYDSAVVVAGTEDAAKNIHPDGSGSGLEEKAYSTWVGKAEYVIAVKIGIADEGEAPGSVICASFNAG